MEFLDDGNSVLYVSCGTCNWSPTCEVYTASLTGDTLTNIVQITSDSAQDYAAIHMGTKVLYGKSDNPAGFNEPKNLYMQDPPGSGEVALTAFAGCSPSLGSFGPTQSPDLVLYQTRDDCANPSTGFSRFPLGRTSSCWAVTGSSTRILSRGS